MPLVPTLRIATGRKSLGLGPDSVKACPFEIKMTLPRKQTDFIWRWVDETNWETTRKEVVYLNKKKWKHLGKKPTLVAKIFISLLIRTLGLDT